MANKPLHKYTVAEASNLQVYESYKCEILTLSGATEQTTATWDTPAKEILFYSAGSVADDDGITISLKVSGSHGADIVLSHDNLPFTVKGMLIEEVIIHGQSGDADAITVLSFH
jgi:hypothetical protein